jgi:hypothetical protein
VQPLHQSTRVQPLHQSTPILTNQHPLAFKVDWCNDPADWCNDPAPSTAPQSLDPKCFETCVLVPGTRERRQLLGRAMADRNQLPVLVMQLKVLPPCRVCLPVSRVCLPVSPTETHVVCVSLCLPASGSSTDRKRARMLYGRGRGCCHAVWRGREGLQKEATGCNRLLVLEVTRVASCF